MIGLKIADIKVFTEKLFIAEAFDAFLVSEAEFVTQFRVTLDGQLTEPPKEGDAYATWQQLRPLAYQIIRGRQLPRSFKIVLKLSAENTAKTLASLGSSLTPQEVGGFFVNIRYENQQLFCVSGLSLRTFSMDKSLEREWDDMLCRFLRLHQIPYERV